MDRHTFQLYTLVLKDSSFLKAVSEGSICKPESSMVALLCRQYVTVREATSDNEVPC